MKLRLPSNITHDLSVIIVSYNTRELTIECVRSVLTKKDNISVEVIVVDNCSSDGSAVALRAEFPDILVLESPTNGGFAYGNNIGLEQCHGRKILLLNPDTEIQGGCLKKGMQYLDANPRVGVLGARIYYPDGRPQNSMIRNLSLHTLFFLILLPSSKVVNNPILGDHRYASLSADEINDVDCVMGSFMMISREVLVQTGGLNTRFFMYGEECEWCHRINSSGRQTVYYPNIAICHHSGASIGHMSVWKAIEMTRGHILFLRFTRGVGVAWLGTLLMTVRDLVRLPYYAFQTVLRGFRPSAAVGPWWARLKFLLGALVNPPKGQSIALPDPEQYRA